MDDLYDFTQRVARYCRKNREAQKRLRKRAAKKQGGTLGVCCSFGDNGVVPPINKEGWDPIEKLLGN